MNTTETEIAARFLRMWSGTGGAGRKPTAAADERLLLVDAPAGGSPGADPRSREQRLRSLVRSWAPLVERIDATDPGAVVKVVLVQEDPTQLDALEGAVREHGWGHHLERATVADPLPTEPGSGIFLIAGDLAAATPRIHHELGLASRALVRLAAPRPADLPFATVRMLAEQAQVDLLLRLPLAALQRLDRYRSTPVADLPLVERRFAEGVATLMGDARYRWLAQFRSVAAERGAGAAVEAVAAHFRASLAATVPDAVVQGIELPPDAGSGAGNRLVLVTHVAERALQMNRALFHLRLLDRLPWDEQPNPLVRMEEPGVIELFAGPTAPLSDDAEPVGSRIRVVDHTALANLLAERFTDRTTLEEVMRCGVERDLFPEDMRSALRLLRRDRRATYRALTSPDDEVRFGEEIADAPRSARTRPRRQGGEPELW